MINLVLVVCHEISLLFLSSHDYYYLSYTYKYVAYTSIYTEHASKDRGYDYW